MTAGLKAALERNERDLRSVVTCLDGQAQAGRWEDVRRLAEGLVRLVSERHALEALRADLA